MLLPAAFPVAFTMLVVGMICWGSWTNAYKLAHDWRLEFFHLDYSLGLFLIVILASATVGTYFSPPSFGENLLRADHSSWLWAAGGGVLVNVGNLMLMVGISRVGMAVAFPISVGLSLVFGTFLTYQITPKGDPLLLALSVGLIFCGVLTNSFAYRYRATDKLTTHRLKSGLGICIASGILFTCSGPMLARAMSSPSPLAPYGACVLYSLGSLIVSGPLLLHFLHHPIEGMPISLADYFTSSFRNHAAGLLGGVVWGAGMLFTVLPAGMVGMPIALTIGQADSLVAALWGIFVWHEFQNSPPRARILLTVMFILYLGGLCTLGLSYQKT
jgi:glucose uptake protein